MEFRQIRYTLAVAKERSFTKAASRLHVSQSAVSEQVKILEERIGFELLERTGSGVEMTDKGKLFLFEAEKVVNDLLSLTDIARHLRGMIVEKLNLGTISGLAPAILPKILDSCDLSDQAQIEVHTAPTRVIFSDLNKGRLDFGFALSVDPDQVPSGLAVTRLFDLDMILIAPPGHQVTQNAAQVKIDCIREAPIIMSELTVGYGLIVMGMLTDLGIRPHIRAIVDNIETLKVMVQSGVGLALVPAGSADNEVKLGLVESAAVEPAFSISVDGYKPRLGLSKYKEEMYERIVSACAGMTLKGD